MPSKTSITHVPQTPSVHAKGTPASSQHSVKDEPSGSSASSPVFLKIIFAMAKYCTVSNLFVASGFMEAVVDGNTEAMGGDFFSDNKVDITLI